VRHAEEDDEHEDEGTWAHLGYSRGYCSRQPVVRYVRQHKIYYPSLKAVHTTSKGVRYHVVSLLQGCRHAWTTTDDPGNT
jgi:hypothetical protein